MKTHKFAKVVSFLITKDITKAKHLNARHADRRMDRLQQLT